MDPYQIANAAADFLDKYTVEKSFFSPPKVVAALEQDPEDEEARANTVLMFQHAAPGDEPDELFFIFHCGQEISEEDPAVVRAADDCMRALKAALPELASFKIDVEINRGD
jgi:hypothetical protein